MERGSMRNWSKKLLWWPQEVIHRYMYAHKPGHYWLASVLSMLYSHKDSKLLLCDINHNTRWLHYREVSSF